jgi:hypothetical protein
MSANEQERILHGQEIADEPHQGHTGTVNVTHRDLGLGSERLGERLELQLLSLILVQPRDA